MPLPSSFNPELVSDQDVMDLIQQEQTTTAGPGDVGRPVAPARVARTFNPVGQQSQPMDPVTLASYLAPGGRASDIGAQLGWSGDPFVYEVQTADIGESGRTEQFNVPVGVTPEFQQFVQSRGITGSVEDFGFADNQVTLFAGGQPVEQFRHKPSRFDRFMGTVTDVGAAAVITLATGGAATAAFAAAGIPAATAAAMGKALAPSIVNLAQTGDFSIEDAARSVAANMIAPVIGAEVTKVVSSEFAAEGVKLTPAVQKAISSSVASGVATALQEGADSSDIGRNMIAGAVAPAVTKALTSAGVDATYATGVGRAAGSYISTGSGVQAIVDGAVRSLTYEQQQRALAEETERKFPEKPTFPGAAETGTIEASSAIQESGVAQEAGIPPTAQQVSVTGAAEGAAQVSPADLQTAVAAPTPAAEPAAAPATQQVVVPGAAEAVAGPSEEDIQAAMRREQVSAPTTAPTPAPAPVVEPQAPITVTGAQEVSAATAEEPFTAVAGAPAPAAEAAAAPAPSPAAQQVEITGRQPVIEPFIGDEEIFNLIQQPQVPAVEPPPVLTAEPQTVPVTARAEGKPPLRAEDLYYETGAIPADERQRVEITGRQPVAPEPLVRPEDLYYDTGRVEQPPEIAPVEPAAPAVAAPPPVPITGTRPPWWDQMQFDYAASQRSMEAARLPSPPLTYQPQTVQVGAQRAPAPEEVEAFGGQPSLLRPREIPQRVDITGTRLPQEVTVTGTQVQPEDLISTVTQAGEPAAAPAPAPTPAPAPAPVSVTPTDIFSAIRRGRPSPVTTVARLAAMDYPVSRTVGLGAFTPAGELEPGGSAKPRQSVWNEASLRLKDALGL